MNLNLVNRKAVKEYSYFSRANRSIDSVAHQKWC